VIESRFDEATSSAADWGVKKVEIAHRLRAGEFGQGFVRELAETSPICQEAGWC
jgi:hypothetical protein